MKSMFVLAFLLLAVAAALFYLHFGGSGNLLVVRLDSVRGINFISQISEIWGTLSVALAINLINLLLAVALWKREQKLAILLPFASSFISLLILIYISNILVIN